MNQRVRLDIQSTRVSPPSRVCKLELRVLRQVSDYQGDREIVGSTLLDAAAVGRQAYLWTLADGEHLLMLMQAQKFCHWLPTREPLARLRERAIEWLTEPPVDASFVKRRVADP